MLHTQSPAVTAQTLRLPPAHVPTSSALPDFCHAVCESILRAGALNLSAWQHSV